MAVSRKVLAAWIPSAVEMASLSKSRVVGLGGCLEFLVENSVRVRCANLPAKIWMSSSPDQEGEPDAV